MKKNVIRILCLCLAVVLPACALAAARMPAMRDAVTDDADVLGQQTAADIAEYAQKVQEKTDISIHVAIVHFLDGLDAQTYANQLFEKWALGDDDLLLLGAAGEDSFATALGKNVQKKLAFWFSVSGKTKCSAPITLTQAPAKRFRGGLAPAAKRSGVQGHCPWSAGFAEVGYAQARRGLILTPLAQAGDDQYHQGNQIGQRLENLLRAAIQPRNV